MYNVFEIKSCPYYNDDRFINSLFAGVKLTKNHDLDRCSYSGYAISLDVRRTFSLSSGGLGKNVVIFGAGMSSSVHVDNKKKVS